MTPAQNIFGTQDEVATLDAEVTLDADETAEDGLLISPVTITTITTTTISIYYHC